MGTGLQDLGRRFVGSWTTEATHPQLPGEVISGSSEVDWMEGQRFLVYRTHFDHPDFPDALAVLGDTDGLHLHYFDTRGVYRLFALTVTDVGWDIERPKRGEDFGQRMSFVFDDAANTIDGTTQLCHDDVTWVDDLMTTYRRAG